MSVHFAAARNDRSPLARTLSHGPVPCPANDHDTTRPAIDASIRNALRAFAEHGLGTTGFARQQAVVAHARGDSDGAAYWIAVCRAFDKRAALQLERKLADPMIGSNEAVPGR
ncbi:MAG: hypothetical protein DI637_12935 [Citromicrobium sp.]|nr:MAG: hypothetical protein DI637_12935 [Citromicrobium sp.]